MKKTLMAMALVLATAGAALANQCPLLIKQIEDATAGKTDDASKKAQALAKADEAAAAIGLTLKKK